ncbi:MAG: ParB/Sulfiredoxin domain [Acidobacteriota bacterium]
MLQPLLVTQGSGGRFDLLAGERRLAAARQAGLQAVPCLLVHADAVRASELRAQAAVVSSRRQLETSTDVATARTSKSVNAEPESAGDLSSTALASERAPHPTGALDTVFTAAVDEIGGALDFVTVLAPAASVARSAFQQAVIADVIKVERRRAAALAAAAASLADNGQLQPEEFDWLEFTEELRRDIALEARLRGVEVEWLHSLKLRGALADKSAMMTAWTGVLHAVLSIAIAGDRVAIAVATPRVRPAIMLTVSLHAQARLTPAAGEEDGVAAAFLGGPGELLVASARHSARRQGGRLSVSTAADSVSLEFVVPQALAYWQ